MSVAEPRVFNPFPGLRPFGREEAHLFFGREEHTDELLARLRQQRFVSVVGASGSGKSSLVLAGLLPALDGGLKTRWGGADWRVARMRPGTDPLGNLARALRDPEVFGDGGEAPDASEEDDDDLELALTETVLRRSHLGLIHLVRERGLEDGENLLVLVDQFEELFRYRRLARRRTGDDAVALVRLLLEAARQEELPLHVLLTLRSDFLGECVQIPGLPEVINQGQYLIPRLNRRQREAVIVGPVRVGGAEVSRPLLQRLLNDVGDDPDQLPILQHALMRTFDLWAEAGEPESPLGLDEYRAAGGLEHALSLHAEEAWGELSERQRGIAAVLFKGLTESRAEGAGVRRPTTVQEIAATAEATPEEVSAVVERFRAPGRAFLVPRAPRPLEPDTLLDISHESLMRVWERLRRWTAEEAEAAEYYARLAQAAELHFAGEAGLYRDPELELALQWRETHRPNEAWTRRYGLPFEPVMEFLETSRRVRDEYRARREAERHRELERARELAEAQRQRAEAQRRSARRLRWAVGLVSVALLAALVATAWALRESEHSRRLSRQSARDEIVALGQAASRSVDADKGFEALLAARQAGLELREFSALHGPDPDLRREAETALLHALHAGVEENRWLGHAAWPNALVYHPDGDWIAAAGYEQSVRRWRPDGTPLDSAGEHDATVFALAVGPGGLLASGDGQGTVRLWPPDAEGRTLGEPTGTPVRALAISSDASLVARGGGDGILQLLRPDGTIAFTQPSHPDGGVSALAFLPDRPALVAAGADGTLDLWRRDTGGAWRRVWRVDAHPSGVGALDVSPDGDRLVTGGLGGTLQEWDLEGRLLRELPGSAPIYAARYSPDGRTVAAAGADRVIRLWAEDGQVRSLPGHEEPVSGLAFSPDGLRLVSTARDMTVRVWRLDNPFHTVLRDHQGTVWEVAVSPDGRHVASCGDDNVVRLWSAEEGRLLRRVHRHRSLARSVAFSPDGRWLASGSHDGTVMLWRTDGSAEPVVVPADPTGVNEVAFGPDGESLVTAGLSGTLRGWSLEGAAPRPQWTHRMEGSQVWGARVGPGGAVLWTGSGPVAHLRTGPDGPGLELPGHGGGIVRGAFAPDGSRVALAVISGEAHVWSRAGEQLFTVGGHRRGVGGVAYTPDGRRLLTAGLDGAIKVWNAQDGSLERTFLGHRGSVTSAVFTPDGAALVSSGSDETVRIWRRLDLSVGRLMTAAESWLADYDNLPEPLQAGP